MDKVDELIEKYAKKLEKVYVDETAGDYTFHGILSELLKEYDRINSDKGNK